MISTQVKHFSAIQKTILIETQELFDLMAKDGERVSVLNGSYAMQNIDPR
jgi:hypothetical protein